MVLFVFSWVHLIITANAFDNPLSRFFQNCPANFRFHSIILKYCSLIKNFYGYCILNFSKSSRIPLGMPISNVVCSEMSCKINTYIRSPYLQLRRACFSFGQTSVHVIVSMTLHIYIRLIYLPIYRHTGHLGLSKGRCLALSEPGSKVLM